MNVVERFLKYVSFDTQSKSNAGCVPSTPGQMVLAKALVEEMKEIGIQDAYMNESGIVYGSIPATKEGCKTVGFLAHMDTSPDMSGKAVKPRIIEHYDGSVIVLNEELGIAMGPDQFEILGKKLGEDLIVTDGTTLLGADDKAGIAEIMTMAERVINSDAPHGEIKLSFTPDEEVGGGIESFDREVFGADFAYTVDGGEVDSVDYENFNAAHAYLEIQGLSIHTGSAKGKMINALLVAIEFQQMMPVFENPAFTEGFEGFNHLNDINGDCEHATMSYLIRNHDEALFEKQKQDFVKITSYLNDKYGEGTVSLRIKESYANMRQIIEQDMSIIERVKDAMRSIGLTPRSQAIRGGTDGARLTYEGLPCPNLGTGGYNYHGRYEFASINEMKQSVELLVKIVEDLAN